MNSIGGGWRLVRWAAVVALALTWAGPALAQEDLDIKFEIKGQIFLETTDFGTGLDRQGSRTDIHFQRLRLVATAKYNDIWGFKFQTCGNCGSSKQGAFGYGLTAQDVDWNDRDIRIIDGYAIADFSEQFRLKIGLTKLPLTRANLDDCFGPLSQDRSFFVYSAYGSSPAKFSRDFGGVAWGGFNDDKLRYFIGAFQGREGVVRTLHPFTGATVTSSIEPSSSFEYVGRAHYAFLDAEPGGGYMGTYLGDLKVFTIGAGFAYEADAVYKNVSPTGAVLNEDTVNYSAFAADMMFEYPTEKAGMVTATAQYLKTDFEDAYKTNFNAGRPPDQHHRPQRAEGRLLRQGRLHAAGQDRRDRAAAAVLPLRRLGIRAPARHQRADDQADRRRHQLLHPRPERPPDGGVPGHRIRHGDPVHRRPRGSGDMGADRQGEGLQDVPPHAAGRRVLER